MATGDVISTAFGEDRVIMFQVGRYLVAVTAKENSALFREDALASRLVPIASQMAGRLR